MSGEEIFDFCCFIYFLCFFCKCHSQCLKNLETWQFKCYFSFIYIFCSFLVLFRYVWMANKYTRKLLRFICMYMDVYLTISLFMLVCIIKKIFNSLHQNDNNPHHFILSAIDTTPNMHQRAFFVSLDVGMCLTLKPLPVYLQDFFHVSLITCQMSVGWGGVNDIVSGTRLQY